MNFRYSLLLILLLVSALVRADGAFGSPVSAAGTGAGPIGAHAAYLVEADERLELQQAVAAQAHGRFTPGNTPVLNFGIGARPVWIHIRVDNATARTLTRRLSVETAWLDRVEAHFRHAGATVAEYRTGDAEPFAQRPVDSRYFVFEHGFAPGTTDVFLRVQTPDPMVIPLYLRSPSQAAAHRQAEDYSYGFLYGFVFALLAYNVMLYAGLRESRYILYSLYLGLFLLMNISYTGHGYAWLWSASPVWAQWSNPVLMMLYAAGGLVFAQRFLATREQFPRMHRGVNAYLFTGGGLLLAAMAMNNQHLALLAAFSFVFVFTLLMLAMGIVAVRSSQKPARYFLLAAISAMVGAATTALAVWGFIPTNVWTYRAVDIGILLDATLLALALTYQFRVGREQKLHAEQLARIDPLTGLNNRRAFADKTSPLWHIAQRHRHSLAVVLMDLDCFKRINDAHGHAYGDEVLKATAQVLVDTVRGQDIVARWGGEEFILLLPETDLHEAAALAERLRLAIEAIRLEHAGDMITITASFGVAERQSHHQTLDALISTADKYLYQAKALGRNRVSCAAVRQAS